MDRPIPPSHFKTQDGDVREDLRRIRLYLEQLNDWVAANSGGGSGDLTQAAADLRYLLRSAGDYGTFAHQAAPGSTSRVLIEDAAASFAKRYATLAEVIAGSAFAVASDINPLHWWRGDNTVQSGGLVDTIVDNGSTAKNFTQTGAPRCPTATDVNGKVYLAPDGVADFYQAGVLADWKFLNDGSQWTVAIVSQRTAAIVAQEHLIDNNDGSTGFTGFSVFDLFVSAGQQGFSALVTNSTAGAAPLCVTSLVLNTGLTVWIFRFSGDNTAQTIGGVVPKPIDLVQRRNGVLVSTNAKANPFSTLNPSFNMTLFRRANTADRFTSTRLYELLLDNKAWSDRQVFGYENYARQQYSLSL